MEEELYKKNFCSCCKKNESNNKECFKFFIKNENKIKTYGCSNYESMIENRDIFYSTNGYDTKESKNQRIFIFYKKDKKKEEQ